MKHSTLKKRILQGAVAVAIIVLLLLLLRRCADGAREGGAYEGAGRAYIEKERAAAGDAATSGGDALTVGGDTSMSGGDTSAQDGQTSAPTHGDATTAPRGEKTASPAATEQGSAATMPQTAVTAPTHAARNAATAALPTASSKARSALSKVSKVGGAATSSAAKAAGRHRSTKPSTAGASPPSIKTGGVTSSSTGLAADTTPSSTNAGGATLPSEAIAAGALSPVVSAAGDTLSSDTAAIARGVGMDTLSVAVTGTDIPTSSPEMPLAVTDSVRQRAKGDAVAADSVAEATDSVKIAADALARRENEAAVAAEAATDTAAQQCPHDDGPQRKAAATGVALKTNALSDFAAIPHIGVEVALPQHWSLTADWAYAWWNNRSRNRYWRYYGGNIGVRYWVGELARRTALVGHHLGAYAGLLLYDFERGGKGSLSGSAHHTLWHSPNYVVGAEYGYSAPLTQRLHLDFVIGGGFWGGRYQTYEPLDGHYLWTATKQRRWFGPTKAEVSLVWQLGRAARHTIHPQTSQP